MRFFLAATALLCTSLTFAGPAEAKSIWLQCGSQEINLDSGKERFSITHINKVYQGRAVFNPGQIDFEFQWQDLGNGGGIKYAYSINRKTLEYSETTLNRIVLPGIDTGWKAKGSESGKCSIIKTPPTAGNKI